MMLEAQKATAAAVEKKGLVTVCSSGLDMCMTGEKKINLGLEGSLVLTCINRNKNLMSMPV